MPPKKTTTQFIFESKAKFGDMYDYALTEYSGSHKKVTIVCKIHGPFERTAREFLDKCRGCPECAPRQMMTTDRFILLSKIIYGETYDYSNVECSSVKDKVAIACKIPGHGSWLSKANNHLSGKSGCPKCAGNQRLSSGDFVKRATEVHKGLYTYVGIEYKNNETPVAITCGVHGVFSQTPRSHLVGQGCPKCAGKTLITTESFISLAKSIHGDKFDYSFSEFKKTSEPITIRCNAAGHVFKQMYGSHIHKRSGCIACAGFGLKTLDKFIEDARKVHGDTYDYSLSNYVNTGTKVTIICKKHGEFSQKPNDHLRGSGCRKCYTEGNIVDSSIFISKATEVYCGKYTYENTRYTGSAKNIEVTCPEHGKFTVRAESHLRSNVGCPECSTISKTALFISKSKAGHGDTYDYSKVLYSGDSEIVTITCRIHGDFPQAAGSHLQGRGCPVCANVGPSKPQIDISEFLGEYTTTILEHKFPGSAKRFDIFLPEKNLAIEYNGLYWHSSRTQIGDKRDMEKLTLGLENGVRTITVFGDEWDTKKESVKNMLLSAIGVLPRLFARKCSVQILESGDVADFYTKNHVLGSSGSHTLTHIGLFNSNNLVACMSFGILRSSRRNTDIRHWELTRFSATHTVVGGASRLLSAFLNLNLCDRLTSYSDVRMFSGKMYEVLGFSRIHQTPPDYHYFNSSVSTKRMHKARFQKKHLVTLFPGCDIENKTEKAICEENGYYQIYDCGKVRWDLEINV